MTTEGSDYTERLQRLQGPRWKRVLDVQRPYRRHIRRLLGDRAVLDVGCGVGRNLAHLGDRAVGVDHNATSVAACRARGLAAVTTDEWPTSAHCQPGRYGGLLCAHVLEHMDGRDGAHMLASYLPCLAPGGLVGLICPQERGYSKDATHVRYVDLAALADLATELGLELERYRSFPFPRLAGRLFTYNEHVLIARLPAR